MRDRFAFPSNVSIPAVVADKLKLIQDKSVSGSVISILGFNNFKLHQQNEAVDEILKAVARNFFIRILDKKLVVICDGKEMTSALLEKTLHNSRSQRRRRSDIEVISGSRAYNNYITFKHAKKQTIPTDFGTFDLYFRETDSEEPTRLSLYRQGMYITDTIPLNSPAYYTKYRPFNAVISIDTDLQNDNEVFQLVRKAEGPKHLKIDESRLQESQKNKFSKFFEQVRDQIKSLCTEESTETFVPSIFQFNIDNSKQFSSKQTHNTEGQGNNAESLTAVEETAHSTGSGSGKSKKGKNSQHRKIAHGSCPIKVTAKRNQKSIELIICAENAIKKARLYLNLHSGSDASCSLPLPDRPIKFRINSAGNGSHNKSQNFGPLESGKHTPISLTLLDDDIPDQAAIKVSIDDLGDES